MTIDKRIFHEQLNDESDAELKQLVVYICQNDQCMNMLIKAIKERLIEPTERG